MTTPIRLEHKGHLQNRYSTEDRVIVITDRTTYFHVLTVEFGARSTHEEYPKSEFKSHCPTMEDVLTLKDYVVEDIVYVVSLCVQYEPGHVIGVRKSRSDALYLAQQNSEGGKFPIVEDVADSNQDCILVQRMEVK